MKIHPTPMIKSNVTFQCKNVSPLSSHNKLRRLPNIFDKVLELPFHANTHVSVQETYDFLKFTVSDTDMVSDVVMDTVEVYPGMVKVFVRSRSLSIVDVTLTEFELDLWRVRLPEVTRPELAYALYEGGDLVVVVPKGNSGSSTSAGNVVSGGCINTSCNNNVVLVN